MIFLFDFHSFQTITEDWRTTVGFRKEDIESTALFLKNIDENDTVIPWKNTHHLLLYEGINNRKLVLNNALLTEIYSIKKFNDFIELFNSLNTSRIQIFTLTRWLYSYSSSKKILDSLGEKHEIGTVTYYTISNRKYLVEEIIKTPIKLNLPHYTSQFIYINIIGIDLSSAQFMTIEIDSNLGSKPFCLLIQDVYGKSTEPIWKYLNNGNYVYYINFINEIDHFESVHHINQMIDLANPSTLSINFSWWKNTAVDLNIKSLDIILIE